MRISRIITGCLLYFLMSVVHAESVYVKDTLRVGVRTEPSNSVAPIGVVLTGMQLKILETRDDYVKIRTEEGLEGWIKHTYVDKEPPAMIKLQQLQKEHAQLLARVGKHDGMLTTVETTNKSLTQQNDALKRTNTELKLALTKEQQRNSQSVSSYFALIFAYLGVFVLGLIIGIIWHRRQAMKRLGGLRV